jgi:cell wall-associated NlpC family hydrolase
MSTCPIQCDIDALEFNLYPCDCDIHQVCLCAISFLGQPYLQAEELTELAIDCSTLTSQSHWIGAQIGIPFIADSQRVAKSGVLIENPNLSKPGDIWVRFSSVHLSPDGEFNHVGIYLGKDKSGNGWVIEARGGAGVILTLASEFEPAGGIKRYLKNGSITHQKSNYQFSRLLSQKVPKMGRLGARQYLKETHERRLHKGLDIYMPFGSQISSPVTGTVEIYSDEIEGAGYNIVGHNCSVRILHIGASYSQKTIEIGALLGSIQGPRVDSISYVDVKDNGTSHVHIEVISDQNMIGDIESHLKIGGEYYFNYLELLKCGHVASIYL